MPPNDPAYGAYLNWLHMSDATLTFPQTLVLRYGRFEPAERQQPQVVVDWTRAGFWRLRAVEAAVAQSEYLCAGALLRPMWRLAMPCCWHNTWAWRRSLAPATQAYWQRLQARPGYQRAMAAQLRAAVEQGVAHHPAPDTQP